MLMAAVLCGGFSTRMGRDKGLIPAGETIQAVSIGRKAMELGLPVVYSVRSEQAAFYATYIPSPRLILDRTDFEGPIRGLASLHQVLSQQDFLLLACDMPEIKLETLQLLIDAYRTGQHHFYSFFADGFFQPFCSVYTAAGLRTLLPQQPYSLQRLLQNGNTAKLNAPPGELFRNCNQ